MLQEISSSVELSELFLQDKNGKCSTKYLSFGWDHKPLPVVGKTRLQLIAEYVEEYLDALLSYTGDVWGRFCPSSQSFFY